MTITPAPYTNLLPAAPPELAAFANDPRWHQLSDAQQAYTIQASYRLKAQGPGLVEAARRFADAINPIAEQLRQGLEALTNAFTSSAESWRLMMSAYAASRLDLQPSERYRLAGSPHGKSSRAKKRWMLEQKRRVK